jgi:hypothetical protein
VPTTPTPVQAASGSTGTATTYSTITPTLGGTATAGNRIVLVLTSAAVFTSPQGGWTRLTTTVNFEQLDVWTRVAAGGETNWGTITITKASAWWVGEFANCAATQPDVPALTNNGAAVATLATPTTAATTMPETLVLAAWAVDATSTNPPNVTSATNSFTLASNGEAESADPAAGFNVGVSVWTRTPAATGTFTSTATFGATTDPASAIVVLRGAPDVSVTVPPTYFEPPGRITPWSRWEPTPQDLTPGVQAVRVAPTPVAFAQTEWSSFTTPKTLPSLTWQADDVIVVVGSGQAENQTLATPTAPGPATVIKEQQDAANATSAIGFTLTNAAVGDTIMLIAANGFYDITTLLAPTGTAVSSWTLQHSLDGGTGDSHMKVWTGTCTTANGTVNTAWSTAPPNEDRYGGVWVFPGTVVFDTAASTDSDTAALAHVAPSATPASRQTNDMLVCLFMSTAVTNYSAPGTLTFYTERDSGTACTFRAGFEQLSSDSATGARSITSSASSAWAAVSVLMKNATTGLAFTALGTANAATSTCWMQRWAAIPASAGSGAISVARTGGTASFGAGAWQYRGSDGVGAVPAIANGINSKTSPLTRSQDHSAVIDFLADWDAGAITGPVWTPTGQTQRVSNAGVAGTFSVLAADWADEGVAGTTSYGITSGGLSTTGNISKALIEVLGTVAPAGGGEPATTAAPATVTAAAVVPAATVQQGAVVAPPVVTALAAVGSPTVRQGTAVTPAVVQATATVAAPAVRAGWTVSPPTVTAAAAIGAPTVQQGAVVAPPAVTGTAGIPAATVQQGAAATAAPSVVAGTVTIAAPTVQQGAATTPGVVPAVAAVPGPVTQAGAGTAPAAVTASAAIPAPAVRLSAATAPAVTAATTAIPAPGTAAAAAATPSVVAATTTVPTPATAAGWTVGPGTVAAVTAVPAPPVTAAWTTTTSAAVAATAAVPAPAVHAQSAATPTVVTAVASVPTPAVTLAAQVSTTTVVAIATVTGTAVIPDTEPPTAPTNLHTTAVGATTADLAWDPASDNTAVTGYEIKVIGP